MEKQPRRIELHEKLCEVLGSEYVYYNPPESVKLKYPCIIYQLDRVWQRYADDKEYLGRKGYDVTVISRDPDENIADQIRSEFIYASFNRRFVNDDLYHDVLTIYY